MLLFSSTRYRGEGGGVDLRKRMERGTPEKEASLEQTAMGRTQSENK